MKCAICGEEGGSAKQELWGPEFAHSTCVIAFKQGQIDGQEGLEQQLSAARAEVEQAFREGFRSPATYNDVLVNDEDAEWKTTRGESEMSKIGDMQDFLKPASDEDGHPITQRQWDEMRQQLEQWNEKAKNWTASPEAGKMLDGYRAMGARCAELEAECDQLCQQLAERDIRIEELEWENKGIDEWRTIASTAIYDNRELRQQLTPLGEFCETLKERIVGLEIELDHEKAVSSRTEVVKSLSEQNESLRQQLAEFKHGQDSYQQLFNDSQGQMFSLRQQLASSNFADYVRGRLAALSDHYAAQDRPANEDALLFAAIADCEMAILGPNAEESARPQQLATTEKKQEYRGVHVAKEQGK